MIPASASAPPVTEPVGQMIQHSNAIALNRDKSACRSAQNGVGSLPGVSRAEPVASEARGDASTDQGDEQYDHSDAQREC